MKDATKKGVGAALLLSLAILPVVSYGQSSIESSNSLTAQLDLDAGITSDATNTLNAVVRTSTTTVQVETTGGYNSDSGRSQAENNTGVNLNVNASGVAVIASSQVQSENDLEVFVSNFAARSNAISKVEINSDDEDDLKVEVVYKHKGRFLGIFPASIKSRNTVEVNADGETEVRSKKSWYSFLVANENYARADVESRIKNNATVRANAKVNVSAQTKAEIAEAIIAELEAHVNAQVEAKANLN